MITIQPAITGEETIRVTAGCQRLGNDACEAYTVRGFTTGTTSFKIQKGPMRRWTKLRKKAGCRFS